MSDRAVASALLLVLAVASSADPGPSRYGLGRTPTRAEIAARNITVFADGEGLPKGKGTAAEGEKIYAIQCAVCHGARGEGRAPYEKPLAGGIGSLGTSKPLKTIGSYWPYAPTVFDYTARAMPYFAPGSLSVNETYAVTAYMLYLEGLVSRTDVLDEKTLPQVKMPNRDGFVPDPRPDVR